MKHGLISALLTGLILFSPLAVGEVYRWVDEKGKVHFGDKPPTKEAEKLKVRPSKGTGTMEGTSSAHDYRELQQRMLDSYDEQQKLKKQEEARKKQQQAETEEKCTQAKNKYDIYDGTRVFTMDKDGNRVYLSEEEVQQGRSELKKWIDTYCN